jgi:hypothetical protein
MTYETRYCAFVDILGFTGALRELNRGSMSYVELREILKSVHAAPPEFLAITEDHDLKVQSISDAVCLSTACTPGGLSHLLYGLEMLTFELLRKGFFLRGGIVRGKLYHDDQMVFGEALVEAYRLESTVARFPRIMIASTVRNDADDFENNEGVRLKLLQFIQQADDGPYYLHALRSMPLEVEDNKDTASYYNDIAQQIQRRFNDAVDNPHHFEKVQWFARYWNNVIRTKQSTITKIVGPNVDPPPFVWS